ncbi:MAG: T9SS type A sorting domain-containing protein, partial [Bacteroidota bacterium]
GIPLVDSVRYKSVQHRDLECDGFGDLMLFSGTFPSLRVRQEVETFDSIWARTFGIWTLFQDSTYTDSTFTWWGNGAGYLLTEATYIGGVLTEITYQDPNPVSVAPGLENELQVFPNPANQQIVVQNDVTLEATFSLMNIQGQTLRTQSLGQGRVEIAVDDLSNGLYMYQFRDDRGQMLKTGKLVIRH